MRIRKLELYGFKSFPDRTVLQFGIGVSCIVGPNGCGKSNVMDAMRWCIGEQSARSLRGSQMMDVVFAGSEDRKPVGFAEVTLTLTSEDGEPFPGEYAQYTEVSVGRRLHRSGASEYVINQQRVRRRDVQDLFMDTGVANNLYSFIEQGRIGKIVHARPAERRSLIDEAAGISRYKVRREEAQVRLQATATQLDRAADVADEMAKRVRSLSRQVLKAARFRRLRSLVRQDEICLSLAKYAALSEDRRALRGQLRTARGELQAAQRERSRREADLVGRHEEVEVVQGALDVLRDEVAALDVRRRELEGANQFAERRQKDLTTRVQHERQVAQRSRTDALGVEVELEAAKGGAEQASAMVTQSEQEIGMLQSEADEAGEAVVDLRSKVAHAQREAAQANLDLDVVVQLSRTATSRATQLPSIIDEAERSESELRAALADRVQEHQRASRSVDAHALEHVDRDRAALEIRASVDHKVSQCAALDVDVQDLQQNLDRAERKAEGEIRAARGHVQSLEGKAEALRRSSDTVVRSGVRAAGEAGREMVKAAAAVQQRDLRAAGERAKVWSREQSSKQERLISKLQVRSKRRREASQSHRFDLERALRDAQQERLREEIEQVQQTLGAHLDRCRARVHEARAALVQQRGELGLVRHELASQQALLAKSTAELIQVEASLQARLASDVGGSAVREALPHAPNLLQVLNVDARTSLWAGRVLGDRVGLLVVHSDDEVHVAAVAAREAGRAHVLLRGPGELSVDEALGGVRVVDSLTEALAHARKSGEAAVVRSTGERIDWDGRVTLGPASAAGKSLLDLDQHRTNISSQVNAERAGVESAELKLVRCDEQLQALTAALETAERKVEGARSQLAEGRASVVQTADQRAGDAAARLHAELDTDREQLEVELSQRAVDLREEGQRLAVVIRRDRDAALSMLERDLVAVVVAAKEQVELAEAQAEHRCRVEVRAQVREAEQAVDSARASIQSMLDRADEHRAHHREALQAARSVAGAAHRELQALRAASVEQTQSVAQAATDTIRARAAMERIGTIVEGSTSTLEVAGRTLTELREELVGVSQQVVDHQLEQDQANVHVLERGLTLERLQLALTQAEAIVDEARSAVAQARVDRATFRERARSAAVSIQAYQRSLADAIDRQQEALKTIEQLTSDRGEAVADGERANNDLAATVEERGTRWDRLQEGRTRQIALRDGLRRAEGDLRELVDGVVELSARVEQLSTEVDAVKLAVDAVKERVSGRYQLSLPGLLDKLDVAGHFLIEPDDAVRRDVVVEGTTIEAVAVLRVTQGVLFDEDAIEQRVGNLAENRERLGRLGEVNLAAVAEYDDVSGRHAELEEQRADLESSIARIRSAIAKMNRTCRQRFRDTFDRVNEHFQSMYPRLVGGGSARLSLTDEEDLLETGVDIFVQPPGKRLQNLSLLSGGEKAMTAIALILSLFKVKPSPFCVLDEVDAPLDEANGSRFNQALVEMAEVSQFIVVTHNRKTMECATTLYGITMPTPGVSRLVSVRVGG